MGGAGSEIGGVRAGALYRLTVEVEQWPIRGGFTISRGSKREAVVVVATISDGTYCGRGECVPYARYKESTGSVTEIVESLRAAPAGRSVARSVRLAPDAIAPAQDWIAAITPSTLSP